MHLFHKERRTHLCLAAIVGLLGCTGCRPTFEASDEAVERPLLDRDPSEHAGESSRWPGWRGHNGSGIAPSGSPAVHFSNTEGVRWKVAVPGRGYSSPVVWDQYVLVTTALDDADPATLAVLCFDRRDGRELWRAEAGKAIGRTHAKNGHASASVTTDGRRVFAFFGSAGLFCLDMLDGGKQLWHADLGDLDHQYGTASSPVLYGNSVIQVCDCEKGSYIAAFDQLTGRRLWRTERTSDGCWSTPVFVEVRETNEDEARSRTMSDGQGGMSAQDPRPVPLRTEMVVNGTQGHGGLIIAYDPADGRELWRVRGTATYVTPLPLVSGGLVYCMSGRNGPIAAIRPGGSGDVTDTHVVWKHSRGGPYIPSGVAYRNRIFVLGDGGTIACYNAGSGQRVWAERLSGDSYTSSLVAAAGRLYAISERGLVSVLTAGDDFELLAKNELDARCLATPAIVDGELLIRTENELLCIAAPPSQPESGPATPAQGPAASDSPPQNDAKPPPAGDSWPVFRGDAAATGVARGTLPEKLEKLWTFTDDRGGFEATAVIADGTVFVGSNGGQLFAVGLADGKKRWEYATSKLGVVAAAAVRNGLVYVGDIDGDFHCIDAKTGQRKWKFTSQGEIDSAPSFYKDTVLFGSQDTFLYCLKADSGELVWKYECPDQIRCCPTVAGDRAFVAGCDGALHVIDLDKGRSVADIAIGGPTGSTPAVVGDWVFVGIEDGVFFGVDWRREKVLWQFQNPERTASYRSSAAATPDAVLVGSRDKQLHALAPKTGERLWTFTTKSRIDSSPVIVGRRAFFGAADGRLYGLDVKTGREVWRFDAGGAVLASPAVAAGRLVIGTDNGDLYCFGAREP
jgi:outer membrane protein assembly factor BamB